MTRCLISISTILFACLLLPARAPAQKAAVIMNGTNPPRTNDQAVIDRLEQDFGMETVLIDHGVDGFTKNEILDNEEPDVIIILESTSSGNVTNQLNDREEPILVQEWFVLDDMGFVLGTSGCDHCWGDLGNDFGNQRNETDLDIVNHGHPIITTAGLDGEVTIAVYESPGRMQWGRNLIDEAVILAVATNGFDEDGDGVSDDVAAFVIEPGAELVDGSQLAGLRIGCWIHTTGNAFINQTPQSLAFWDAMLTYALDSTDPPPPPKDTFLRGDTDGSGIVDISDPIFNLTFQFVGGIDDLPCEDAADVDDSSVLDISDPIYNLTFQFVGGIAPPPAPGQNQCGVDPTDDELSCEQYESCP